MSDTPRTPTYTARSAAYDAIYAVINRELARPDFDHIDRKILIDGLIKNLRARRL